MKSNKHENCNRQFTILSQSWYGEAQNLGPGEDEIGVGMFHPDGGTTGEFAIRWTMLGGKSTAYLHAFNDSWSALGDFPDVLQGLTKLDGTDPTVSQVVAVLLECGVVDATERRGPRSKNPGSIAEAESAVQIYRGTLQAYEALRSVARAQGNAPTWAENAEFGVATKSLSSVDSGLSHQVLDFAKTLMVRREAAQRAVRSVGDPALDAKYQDIFAVPADVTPSRHRK